MNLTTKQREFIDSVAAGRNIFLTGKAGTGKSFIVREAIRILIEQGKPVIAVAPTGIAANNIDGQTIHSMFKINPFGVVSFASCNFIKAMSKKVLKVSKVIFIDEVSMLRPDLLDGMHWTMKKNGIDGLDKKQVIFVGDMKQLPPIMEDNTRSVLYQTYDGEEFDHAQIFQKLDVVTIELDEVLRQTNEDFLEALNQIRDGNKSEYFRQFVHAEPKGIILAPHNSTVAKYNQIGLQQQEGKEYIFKAKIEGDAKASDFNLEQEIRVKDGCKIMYLVNSQNNPLRNGTLGTFISRMTEEKTGPTAKKERKYFILVNGVEYALQPVINTKREYVYNSSSDALELEELGSMTQYPFKLAYALTIHKAQGLTFDEVTIDLTKPCFQKGQMYVALSRVRTPEGLRIKIK